MAKFLTTQQTAELFGLSKSFLEKDRVTKLHGIPFAKVGRRVLYDPAAVESWLKAHTVNAGEAKGEAVC